MKTDVIERAKRMLLLLVGAALVALRFGWPAVAFFALAVALQAVEALVSRSQHESEVKAIRADVDELKAQNKKLLLMVESLHAAARKPGF